MSDDSIFATPCCGQVWRRKHANHRIDLPSKCHVCIWRLRFAAGPCRFAKPPIGYADLRRRRYCVTNSRYSPTFSHFFVETGSSTTVIGNLNNPRVAGDQNRERLQCLLQEFVYIYIYSNFVHIFVLSIYEEARSSFLRFAYIRYNKYNTNDLHWEYGHRQLVWRWLSNLYNYFFKTIEVT